MVCKYLIVAMLVLKCFCPSEARICDTVEIRNSNITAFKAKLTGCAVITGNLSILLCHFNETAWANLQFPELKEVRGYFFMYRVRGLTNVGTVFPNLSVVRGRVLIKDYAIIMDNVYDLKQIGLKNLQTVERGFIRIENCNKLCHYAYLKHIVGESNFHTFTLDDSFCSCPAHCKEGCISQGECYVRPKCHDECIGCSGPGSDQCYACKNIRNANVCVSQCPSYPVKKYINKHLGECVTKEQCLTLKDSPEAFGKKFFIYENYCLDECLPKHITVPPEQGYCIPCKDRCRKDCDGMKVEDLGTLTKFKHCTHINGSLILRQINATKYAHDLEENLEDIEEIGGYLKIERSPTLTSLDFLPNLKVIHGNELEKQAYALYVFENKNLQNLWNWTKDPNTNRTLEIRKGGFAFHGNPQLCKTDIIEFGKKIKQNWTDFELSGNKENCVFTDFGARVVTYGSTKVVLEWKPFRVENRTLLGYLIYYTEASDSNQTLYYEDNDNMCDAANWKSIFWQNNSIEIKNLLPFTQYGYYVKAFANTLSGGGQMATKYFTTLSDDPSQPVNVKTSSNSSDGIYMVWGRPATPNGVLSHYSFVLYIEEEDEEFLSQRNFCNPAHNFESMVAMEEPIIGKPVNISCPESCILKKKEDEIEDKFGSLCKNIFTLPSTAASAEESCKRFSQRVEDVDTKKEKRRIPVRKFSLSPNASEYYVNGLRPFTMYVVYVQACNENRTEKAQCSDVVMKWQRTLKSEKADTVSDISTSTGSDGMVSVRWREPENPNGIVLAYKVQHRRAETEYAQFSEECITRKQFLKTGDYLISGILPVGKYEIQITTISLAGHISHSNIYYFEMSNDSNAAKIGIGLTILFIIVIVAGVSGVFVCKKRHRSDDLLMGDINPDYASSSYVEDEWEVERSNVQLSGEIGQGSFGMVCSGVMNPSGIECAIKTVNEKANFHDKMQFLNEAAVMRAFNDAHHVVKLLGVVSRGDPPLVIMELMARGDLKSFLRQSRESSQNITCVEMYRMAAEIADGMAYLSGKKFVHRDLAARNCMVAADHTVKIGDFGMARDVYETDYYRKETRGLLPVRWMAPESLSDGVFTSDSDVWSYGVVLWEMVTLAEQPYQGLANEQVLQFIVSRGTLTRPEECPDLLWSIMETCWKWRPHSRPMFIHIVEKLEGHVGPDFKLVSYYHSKTGEELRVMAKERVVNAPALSNTTTEGERVVHWKQNDEDDDYDEESCFYGEQTRPNDTLYPYQRHRPPSSNFLDDHFDDDFITN